MQKHGIIWDLDGTIIDSFDVYYSPFPSLFVEYGIKKETLSKEEYRSSYYGRSIEGIFKDYLEGEVSDETCLAMAADYVHKAAEEFRNSNIVLVLGVERVLKHLWEAGHPMAIASSSWLPAIITPLEKTGLLKYFSNIISGYLLPSKPAPDIFRIAADSISCQHKNCLVFEDSLAGMSGAKKAGMKCVGIATTKTVAEMTNADIALKSYSDLDLSELDVLINS